MVGYSEAIPKRGYEKSRSEPALQPILCLPIFEMGACGGLFVLHYPGGDTLRLARLG